MALCCVALCCVVLCCIVLGCVASCCVALCCVVLCCVVSFDVSSGKITNPNWCRAGLIGNPMQVSAHQNTVLGGSNVLVSETNIRISYISIRDPRIKHTPLEIITSISDITKLSDMALADTWLCSGYQYMARIDIRHHEAFEMIISKFGLEAELCKNNFENW